MERIYQQNQLLGVETSTKINDLFRQKVQYEDMLKDVDAQIHYARGVLEAVGQMQDFIRQTQKQDKAREKFEQEALKHEHDDGDGSKDSHDIPAKGKEVKT